MFAVVIVTPAATAATAAVVIFSGVNFLKRKINQIIMVVSKSVIRICQKENDLQFLFKQNVISFDRGDILVNPTSLS